LCYKATAQVQEYDENRKQVNKFNPYVWFTPTIPTSFGPAGLDGLPGLVLEGTFNGRLYYYATNISFNHQTKLAIDRPKSGKFITQEELTKINAEIFKRNN
jgi:GLPGLI family protein